MTSLLMLLNGTILSKDDSSNRANELLEGLQTQRVGERASLIPGVEVIGGFTIERVTLDKEVDYRVFRGDKEDDLAGWHEIEPDYVIEVRRDTVRGYFP